MKPVDSKTAVQTAQTAPTRSNQTRKNQSQKAVQAPVDAHEVPRGSDIGRPKAAPEDVAAKIKEAKLARIRDLLSKAAPTVRDARQTLQDSGFLEGGTAQMKKHLAKARASQEADRAENAALSSEYAKSRSTRKGPDAPIAVDDVSATQKIDKLNFHSEDFGPYSVGVTTACGDGGSMEDRTSRHWFKEDGIGVAGVFDGHGGDSVAEAAAKVVPGIVHQHLMALSPRQRRKPALVAAAIKNAFADPEPRDNANYKLGDPVPSVALKKDGTPKEAGPAGLPTVHGELLKGNHGGCGSTAVVAVFVEDSLYIANLGDSRAVLVKRDGSAQRLSNDQKVEARVDRNYETIGIGEGAKIQKRGGVLIENNTWRIAEQIPQQARPAGGGLHGARRHDTDGGTTATARALGDFRYDGMGRRPQVTRVTTLDTNNVAVLLMSDGLTGRVSDEANAGYAAEQLAQGETPENITTGLVRASYNRRSHDNLTANLIVLNPTFPPPER